MGIKIEVVNSPETVLRTTQNAAQVVVASKATLPVSSQSAQPVVIEVLKGAKGDDMIFVGDTPPPNPMEGQVWINTSIL